MPLMLTPVGEALLPLAEAMLHAADQSILRTDAASNSRHGRLSIGFYPGIANGPLRQALIVFRTERPEIDLILVEAMPGELHGQLRSAARLVGKECVRPCPSRWSPFN